MYKDDLKKRILEKIEDLTEKLKSEEPMPEREQDIDFLVEVDEALEEILHNWYY